jgi:hypothetical protein
MESERAKATRNLVPTIPLGNITRMISRCEFPSHMNGTEDQRLRAKGFKKINPAEYVAVNKWRTSTILPVSSYEDLPGREERDLNMKKIKGLINPVRGGARDESFTWLRSRIQRATSLAIPRSPSIKSMKIDPTEDELAETDKAYGREILKYLALATSAIILSWLVYKNV